MSTTTNADIFKYFAPYYDSLYSNKDYAAEADYLERLFSELNVSVKKIVNLGCGTGKHDSLLAEKGYALTGVDRSAEMLQIARKRAGSKAEFVLADMRDMSSEINFDAALCLFDSINYLLTDSELQGFFKNTRALLNQGGLFIFDTWNGTAAKMQPLLPQSKLVSTPGYKLNRTSKLSHAKESNQVSVDYTLEIQNLENNNVNEFHETHTVRYLFPDEIRNFAAHSSFEVLRSCAWLEHREMEDTDWNVCWVLRAI